MLDNENSSLNEESNYKFITESISEAQFDKLYATYHKEYQPKEVTDFDSVKKLLGNVVEWVEEQREDEDGNTIKLGHLVRINFRDGKKLVLLDDEQLKEIGKHGWSLCEHTSFMSYFPEENILLLSEENYGDGGDQSYNLTTGDLKEVAGDPKVSYFPQRTRSIVSEGSTMAM